MGLLACVSIFVLVQGVAATRNVVDKPKLKLKIAPSQGPTHNTTVDRHIPHSTKNVAYNNSTKRVAHNSTSKLQGDHSQSLKVHIPKKAQKIGKLDVQVPKKEVSKPEEPLNPAQCFDMSAGSIMNVQTIKEHFGNHSFLLSLAPGAMDPSGEKAMTTLYEALLGDCQKGGKTSWVVDVGAGSGTVSALAAGKGCKVTAFDPDATSVQTLKTSRCLNRWTNNFRIFPMMAASRPGGDVTVLPEGHTLQSSVNGNTTGDHVIHGVSLDGLFVKGDEKNFSLDKEDQDLDTLKGDVALLKVTPQSCCTPDTVLKALQGAQKLLASGRVQCLAMEMNFENTTEEELDILRILEERGYKLAQTGPGGSFALEISKSGTYVLYSTDTKQLSDVHSTMRRIRTFDERSGLRAYGNGISLNRDGKFFEYGELVFACKSGFPDKIEVRPTGKTRFGNGMWWIEKQNATNMTFAVKDSQGIRTKIEKVQSFGRKVEKAKTKK